MDLPGQCGLYYNGDTNNCQQLKSFVTRINYSKQKGVVNLTFGVSSLKRGSEKRRNQFWFLADDVKQRAA
jgi:hypothetical protein